MFTGSSLPPLLFVHGAFHGSWCWKEHFLPYFSSQGFSCYAPNLRGHGGSEGFEKLHTFSLRDYMDNVLEVMAPLKEKPVLIGHSMGGAIVQKIVHAYPDKIKAAILLASAPPEGMLKDNLRLFLTHFWKVFLFNRRKSVDLLVPFLFSNRLAVAEEDKYTKLLQPESRQVMRDLNRRIVSVPTLLPPQFPMLVLGSKNDAIYPEKTVLNTRKIYKSHSIIFDDLCHDMMLDPEWRRVADAMHIFLRETVLAGEKSHGAGRQG